MYHQRYNIPIYRSDRSTEIDEYVIPIKREIIDGILDPFVDEVFKDLGLDKDHVNYRLTSRPISRISDLIQFEDANTYLHKRFNTINDKLNRLIDAIISDHFDQMHNINNLRSIDYIDLYSQINQCDLNLITFETGFAIRIVDVKGIIKNLSFK